MAVNHSTTRGEREIELRARHERAMTTAAALKTLADAIRVIPATRSAYVPIWATIAARLDEDARGALRDARRATERLHDLDDAQRAAERWIPTRSSA